MRDERLFLLDMLESATLIGEFVAGRTRAALDADRMLREAVLRRLEIVGEAARRISATTRAQVPLPWADIVSTRNILAHVYFGVDLDIVWETATTDIPALISTIQSYLDRNPLEPSDGGDLP
jgi:uncharacterized protein with HEPN domain